MCSEISAFILAGLFVFVVFIILHSIMVLPSFIIFLCFNLNSRVCINSVKEVDLDVHIFVYFAVCGSSTQLCLVTISSSPCTTSAPLIFSPCWFQVKSWCFFNGWKKYHTITRLSELKLHNDYLLPGDGALHVNMNLYCSSIKKAIDLQPCDCSPLGLLIHMENFAASQVGNRRKCDKGLWVREAQHSWQMSSIRNVSFTASTDTISASALIVEFERSLSLSGGSNSLSLSFIPHLRTNQATSATLKPHPDLKWLV